LGKHKRCHNCRLRGEAHHSHPLLPGTRMLDLVSMQPNIRIDLFMVASDERREMAACEIHRPAFVRLKLCAPGSEGIIPQSCTLPLARLLSPLDSSEDLIQCQIN